MKKEMSGFQTDPKVVGDFASTLEWINSKWNGVAIKYFQKHIFVHLHLQYHDKDLAKANGFRWNNTLKSWYKTVNIVEIDSVLKEILSDADLCEALCQPRGEGKPILFIEETVKKIINNYNKNKLLKNNTNSDSLPKELPTGDVEIVPIVKKVEPLQFSVGLVVSKESVSGFAIRFPYSKWHISEIHKLASEVEGKAHWNESRNFWRIPLSVANLFTGTHRQKRMFFEFFEDFSFTDGAKIYFTDFLESLERLKNGAKTIEPFLQKKKKSELFDLAFKFNLKVKKSATKKILIDVLKECVSLQEEIIKDYFQKYNI